MTELSKISQDFIRMGEEQKRLGEVPFGEEIEQELMAAISGGDELPWTKRQDDALNWIYQKIFELKYLYSEDEDPVSADRRDQYLVIARESLSLSQKIIEIEDLAKVARDEILNLQLLCELAQLRANSCDPSLNRRRKKYAHYKLAFMLAEGIALNEIDIPMRVNKDSQLARIFRSCCRAAGLEVPEAGHNYLSDAVAEAKIFLAKISRNFVHPDPAAQAEIDELLQKLSLGTKSSIEYTLLVEKMQSLRSRR